MSRNNSQKYSGPLLGNWPGINASCMWTYREIALCIRIFCFLQETSHAPSQTQTAGWTKAPMSRYWRTDLHHLSTSLMNPGLCAQISRTSRGIDSNQFWSLLELLNLYFSILLIIVTPLLKHYILNANLLSSDMREMRNLLSKLRETMPLPLKNQGLCNMFWQINHFYCNASVKSHDSSHCV